MSLTWAERADSIIEETINMVRRIGELEEEKKRLRNDIDMTKPQPCTRFRHADNVEWLAKLVEETNEVIQEAYAVSQLERTNSAASCEAMNEVLQDARRRRAMELTDVITVCVSWLDADGWDEEARGELQKEVNEKNKVRNYF